MCKKQKSPLWFLLFQLFLPHPLSIISLYCTFHLSLQCPPLPSSLPSSPSPPPLFLAPPPSSLHSVPPLSKAVSLLLPYLVHFLLFVLTPSTISPSSAPIFYSFWFFEILAKVFKQVQQNWL